MGLVLTAVFGFGAWIVLWSLDWKSFDAFMITTAILIVGVTVRIAMSYLPGSRDV